MIVVDEGLTKCFVHRVDIPHSLFGQNIFCRNFPVKNTNNQTQRPGNEKNYLKIRLIETDRSITVPLKIKQKLPVPKRHKKITGKHLNRSIPSTLHQKCGTIQNN
jgi:hypothetical protein